MSEETEVLIEPATGRAGEDIPAGSKIVLCADGLWRCRIHVTEPPPAVRRSGTARKSRRSAAKK